MTERTAVLIAAYDSQLKWVGTVRAALEERGVACRTVVPTDVRHAISPAQQQLYGHGELEYRTWRELVREGAASDVVVLGIQGPLASRYAHDLYDQLGGDAAAGPITVTGWVGVIIEKITAGYLERFSTDVVAVNSRSDLRVFEAAARGLGLSTDNLVLSGLPLLSAEKPKFSDTPVVPRAVLFADQPTVPVSREDRSYVYRRLIRYAQRHPDRRVILKPRHRPGEDTFHRMQFHPESLLRGISLPPNFSVDYTPISQQLHSVDLLLTVSSTAALEAIGAATTVGFVADLGVREQLGNHIFVGSGLLRTFDQIEADELGVPEQEWIDDYFFGSQGPAPAQVVARRVIDLLDRRQSGESTPQQAAWRSSYFTTQHAIARSRASEADDAGPVGPGVRARVSMIVEAVLPVGVHRGLRRQLAQVRRRLRSRRSSGSSQ